jgi:hypothetical protein
MFEPEREEIRKRIQERVIEHWELTHKALLLAKLGGPIKREFPTSALVIGKFSDFVRTCPGIRIVEHPVIREKIGAIPVGVMTPLNVAELFVEDGGNKKISIISAAPPAPPGPYFAPDFWKAFHTPLTGKRFVIPPNETHPLRIVDGELPDGESGYEVLSSDLPLLPPEAPKIDKIKAVAAKIRAWIARHDLTEQPFRDRPKILTHEAPVPAVVTKKTEHPLGPSLSEALANLHPSEQARISIPLDIVLKMLSER